MAIREDKKKKNQIQGVSPEEYASYWGCDSNYDKPPNQIGDGALFYNFSSEIQKRDVDYLTRFDAAIDRTIENVKSKPESFEPEDIPGLLALKAYIRNLIPER
jgi:hypothetical protein